MTERTKAMKKMVQIEQVAMSFPTSKTNYSV